MSNPFVSIVVITYNHVKYIEPCVRSLFAQKTTFPFEVIVGDDFSSDGTRELLQRIKKEFGERLVLLLHKERQIIPNRPDLHGKRNFIQTYNLAKGKYIAFCDGDDYWTDPKKLQKQVNVLESSQEYSLCFHNVEVLDESKNKAITNYFIKGLKEKHMFQDLIKGNYIPTCSILFYGELLRPLPEWINQLPMGDWPMWLTLLQKGDAIYIEQVMGVYRIHENGIWASKGSLQNLLKDIESYHVFEKQFSNEHRKEIRHAKKHKYYLLAKEYLELKQNFHCVVAILNCLIMTPMRSWISTLLYIKEHIRVKEVLK